jgi:hypothetical protein
MFVTFTKFQTKEEKSDLEILCCFPLMSLISLDFLFNLDK